LNYGSAQSQPLKTYITYLIAICPSNNVVDVLDKESLKGTIFLSFDILQVVGMYHSNNMVELICPPIAMVVPVQVLRFF
jgi:hypothetical protein